MAFESKNLSRNQVAERLGTSTRTVDRLRKLGLLPWFDLKKGNGHRPIVRFRIADVEAYEATPPRRG